MVFLNEILISALNFLERLLKPPSYTALRQKSINQALVVICEIIIVWTASCISNELRNMHTIRRARWYVAGKELKIDNVEVKIITFVIYPGSELASTVFDECEIKVVCFLFPLVSERLQNQLISCLDVWRNNISLLYYGKDANKTKIKSELSILQFFKSVTKWIEWTLAMVLCSEDKYDQLYLRRRGFT